MTFTFHDYETNGLKPNDKSSQFAAVQTDENLNYDKDKGTMMIYCKPSMDVLPSPVACMVTKISPMEMLKKGLPEFEFATKINDLMMTPNSTALGYNTIGFDDEFTRNLFYRNFFPVYDREYKNGNSRWDIIDVVRAVYAFKPETLNWTDVQNEDGSTRKSMRLEHLAKENGISQDNAHDARDDVYATIDLAKIIKEKQPKLYEHFYNLRSKHKVKSTIMENMTKPLWLVNSFAGSDNRYLTPVLYITSSLDNVNEIYFANLNGDLSELKDLSVEEIQRRMYLSKDDLEAEGISRPAILKVQINKCPLLVPINTLSDELAEDSCIDKEEIFLKVDTVVELVNKSEIMEKIIGAFTSDYDKLTDPDAMLYDGFPSKNDSSSMHRIMTTLKNSGFTKETKDTCFAVAFEDPKFDEMVFRLFGRNNHRLFNTEEIVRWADFCREWLTDESSPNSMTLDAFNTEMAMLVSGEHDAIKKGTIKFDQKTYDDLIQYSETLKSILFKNNVVQTSARKNSFLRN